MDIKGANKKAAKKTTKPVNNPIIINGKCSFCPFDGDILNETVVCYSCSKSYHTTCRNSKGSPLTSSICTTPFFEVYSPISSHYGVNKKRWGKFAFICEFCNTPDLFNIKASDKIIDVVNVIKESPNKSSDTQTFISGNMNGFDSVCELDYNDKNASNSTLLDNVKTLLDLNNQILDGIKSLQTDTATNSENFAEQVNVIKNCLNDSVLKVPATNFVDLNSLTTPSNSSVTSTVNQKCEPYTDLLKDFLDTKLLSDLTEFLSTTEGFEKIKSKSDNSSRDVLYYGEFKYRYGAVTHAAKEIPEIIQPIVNKISEVYPNLLEVNSCLVTRYQNGSNICPPHSDDEPFIAPKSNIFTLSIGSQRSMAFTSIDGTSSTTLDLPNNSLLSCTRVSQEHWRHEIPAEASSPVRFSLTFRLLAPYYANTTLIVGDSNTEHINFGSGRNKLGVWLPGERIKASKICNIPSPGDITTPYRHMVIHCGINDLRSTNHLPIPVLAKNLNDKCNALLKAFPKMKIHISSILPTKDPGLNAMANELNQYILGISRQHQNLSIISHINITDHTGLLSGNYGRHNPDGTFVKHDTVHLGSKGIALLCMNIKKCIVKLKPTAPLNNVHENSNMNQNIVENSKYPYWFPNQDYHPDLKAPTPIKNPWNGNHGCNFADRSFQPFSLSFSDGFQS